MRVREPALKALGMNVELSQVSFAYGEEVVFERASMRAQTGRITTVLGPSGSGKSTLLQIIAGVRSAEGDVILGDGIRASDLFRTGQAAMFLQNAFCFPWATVRQNIELALRLTESLDGQPRESVTDLIERVGLKGRENSYPKTLSVGMQARVGLARALVTRPRLLLVDEPCASLDILWKSSIYELLLEEAARGTTIILATHDLLETLYLSTDIYVISPSRRGLLEVLSNRSPGGAAAVTRSDPGAIFSGLATHELAAILRVTGDD